MVPKTSREGPRPPRCQCLQDQIHRDDVLVLSLHRAARSCKTPTTLTQKQSFLFIYHLLTREVLLLKFVDYGRMAEILVQRAGSPDEFTRLTTITWVDEVEVVIDPKDIELTTTHSGGAGDLLSELARRETRAMIKLDPDIDVYMKHDNRQEGQTISAPASTAVGNVAGSTKETQT
ncbi:hypothetical protein JHK87_000661 [Glycine soja]|nr:hypothetical protein JHK87_000661 [Glycine soja]